MKQVAALLMLAGAFFVTPASASDDPYLWLEEIEGGKALDFARAENKRSLAELESHPYFAAMKSEAQEILRSDARLPLADFNAGFVYNFWQDKSAVRGLWRRSDTQSYLAGSPIWETLIDYDALAAAEDRNWIHGDIVCLGPVWRRCMIELSDGGKDAAIWREFDIATKSFVDGGFALGEAKSTLDWIDADTLLVGTDTGEGSLTESGYARVLRIVSRGADVKSAPVFAEADPTDVWMGARVENDGGKAHIFGVKGENFFESTYLYAAKPRSKPTALPAPRKSSLEGVLDGRAIFSLREPWAYQGKTYPTGAVVAYDLKRRRAELVMAPAKNQSIETVSVSKSDIFIAYLEDVAGKAARLTRDRKMRKWHARPIDLPAAGVVKLVAARDDANEAIFSFESMTQPNTLFHAAGDATPRAFLTAGEFYDATDIVVEQRFATSKDGTKVPYFLMAKKATLANGSAPTVQFGYGGFLNPVLPLYHEEDARPQHGALAGKLWVSRGGVLVLSNIRGGSEYGPDWHAAALKENRQRSFDDFIAISEDLIAKGVTTPKMLGAIGRSNGGLLMGAVMTQRPELYGAFDIGVPLLDMQRYDKLLAGASWVAEFGDPDIAEEWAYISAYSPYQKHDPKAEYPAPLFYTSTKDDRVHPGHARKMAAKMKAAGQPFYYYENMEGGHGGAANQEQLAYRAALEYAYFAKMLMGK
jgi:prolyl oligopeptidase